MLVQYAVIAGLLLVIGLGHCEHNQSSTNLRIAQSCNTFSGHLYQAVRSQPGNIIMSPLSAATLLAMCWLGSGGYSAHELVNALHLPDDVPEVKEGFEALLSSLQLSQSSVTLDNVNRLFIQQGFRINESFRLSMMKNFHSGLDLVDFRSSNEAATNSINKWVEKATHNKIQELIAKGSLDVDTKLILANAVYFKGHWLKPFVGAERNVEPFFLESGSYVEVPMMYQSSKFYMRTFKDLKGLKILKLPYSYEALSMVILLPKNKHGLDCLEGQLSVLNITDLIQKLGKRSVEVTIPRFKIEMKLDFKDALMNMGIQEIFSEKANLSGISQEPMQVNKIVQKSFIEVTENGTEAAAATEMDMIWRSGKPHREFKANHPFMFFIYDERSKCIIFMGRVVNPLNTTANKSADVTTKARESEDAV